MCIYTHTVYIYTYCVYIHIYIYMYVHGLLQILLCHFFRAILYIYTPILCLQCIINFVDCRQIYLHIRIPIPHFHCCYLLLLCQRWRLKSDFEAAQQPSSPAAQVPNDAFAPPVMGLPSSPHEKPGPGPPGPPGMAPPAPPKAPGPPPSAGLSVAK